jgi:pimeloyl-ACP methyl ester carboxylesterase
MVSADKRFVRSASSPARGGRRPVVLVHGSLSSGGMWKTYAAGLASRYDVRTPDLTGYGARAPWPVDEPFSLSHEAACIAESVADIDGPIDIVGHSYGGMVALRYLWENPGRVRSLMLFEPTFFRVLADPSHGNAKANAEIAWVSRTVRESVALGAPEAAMCHFVEYWNGPGSWRALPEDRQARFVEQAATVARNFTAGAGDDMPLSALTEMAVPALVVSGFRSTAAAQAAALGVAAMLPLSELVTIAGVPHMMPLTHPDETLRLIAAWLGEGRVATPMAA